MTTKKNKTKKQITDFKEIERAIDNPTKIPKSITKEDKVESEAVWDNLTPRQLKFIELYTWDLLGNWVQSYLEVYDVDTSKKWWYKTACAASSRLLSNVKVFTKINQMLEESWLNDQFIDKQLLFLASQHDDKTNKLWAIKEYNKLKKRITEKVEHSWWFTLAWALTLERKEQRPESKPKKTK